jgi:hypothetical protein
VRGGVRRLLYRQGNDMEKAENNHTSTIWKVRSRNSAYEWQGSLTAYWEVLLDPISDEYTPDEIDAHDLLDQWAEQVRKECTNELVPIYWYIECTSEGKFERMPFQPNHTPGVPDENFLTFYTWPINSRTGQRLNWLTLPVQDKSWHVKRADKGGFLQEATGWKPSILQPYVYLPALLCLQD